MTCAGAQGDELELALGVWIRLGLRVVARVSAIVPSRGTPASRLRGNRSEADAWSMSEVPPCPAALCRRPCGPGRARQVP
jgi:hypothetical protein